MRRYLFAALFAWGLVGAAVAAVLNTGAPTQPQGQITWNQAIDAIAVTTNDTTPLSPNPTRWLYNGNASACSLVVKLSNDTATVTLSNVQPGALLPIAATLVTTASTCSNIVALY